METLGSILGAFFLFLVILPVFGFVVSATIRVLAPYLIGSSLTVLQPGYYNTSTLIGVAFIWLCLTLAVRVWLGKKNKSLAWHEGHYTAASAILTLGLFVKGNRRLESVSKAEVLSPAM
jgi:hypothetical protein